MSDENRAIALQEDTDNRSVPAYDRSLTTAPDRDAELDPVLADRLRATHLELAAKVELLPPERLAALYQTFRRRFSPDVLAGLDGEQLLLRMHERKTKESLVYWLEFKNDEEFPAHFGSIAGGSALKFGIYQSSETGRWMAGSGQQQQPISLEEAIERARSQRREMAAGAAVLEEYAARPEKADYAALEARLQQVAPEVARSAWGHKYFSLLYPQLLDDYHVLDFQRFHLTKLLQPSFDERYRNAGPFLRIARQLGWHVNTLTTVLNELNGSPHLYWRVGTGASGEYWDTMRRENVIAVGWSALPDLRPILEREDREPELRRLLAETYRDMSASQVGKQTNELLRFATRAQLRHRVLAMQGGRVLGIGEIAGGYSFQAGSPCPHRRPVRWLHLDEWQAPEPEGLRTSFVQLRRYVPNLIEVERRVLHADRRPVAAAGAVVPKQTQRQAPPPLDGTALRIQAALERKRQVILCGPPGTGKTYWATKVARELAVRERYGCRPEDLSETERADFEKEHPVELCCFHPAYGYEDFVEGFRPSRHEGGQVGFELRDGIFKSLCKRAAKDAQRSFFLIIDEINRGDVPRIFGELLLALEKDKRGVAVSLPVSGDKLVVPENLHVIATMNTADRSIAVLDAALRRRFAFIELMPDTTLLKKANAGGIPLGPWLNELNVRINKHVGRDARHLQIGHAYLIENGEPVKQLSRFAEILRDDIVPLLSEYCYSDFAALASILGEGLVDAKAQRIDQTIFEPGKEAAFLDKITQSFQTIMATVDAAAADVTPEDADESDADEDEGEGAPSA